MVQSPLYLYNHLKGDFERRFFKPILMDTCIFYRRGMIALIYVDFLLLFGTNQDKIYEAIKELEDSGVSLTVEKDVYNFLVFEVKTDN